MVSCSKLAQHKIDEAKTTANEAVKRIQNSEAPLDIVEFFPAFKDPAYSARTNIPRGVSIPQFVLLGRQGIFDLRPLSPHQFRSDTRISIETAVELVERRILIPNLYYRDPEDWKNAPWMYDLVERSHVNGEGVDAFMRLKNPDYGHRCETLTTRLRGFFTSIPLERRRHLCNLSWAQPVEKLEMILAKRWAYLHVFAPSVAERADQYLQRGEYESFALCVRIGKHQYVSSISAAIGGRFVWGKPDLLQRDELGNQEDLGGEEFVLTEELEYLVTCLCNVKPFARLCSVDEKQLLAFIDNNDNIQVRNRIWALTYELALLAQESRLAEPNVHEYMELVDDYRRRLRVFAESADWTTTLLVGMAGTAIGWCFGGYAAVLGGLAGAGLGKAGSKSSGAIGRSAFRLFTPNRDAYHVICAIDDLRGRRND